MSVDVDYEGAFVKEARKTQLTLDLSKADMLGLEEYTPGTPVTLKISGIVKSNSQYEDGGGMSVEVGSFTCNPDANNTIAQLFHEIETDENA